MPKQSFSSLAPLATLHFSSTQKNCLHPQHDSNRNNKQHKRAPLPIGALRMLPPTDPPSATYGSRRLLVSSRFRSRQIVVSVAIRLSCLKERTHGASFHSTLFVRRSFVDVCRRIGASSLSLGILPWSRRRNRRGGPGKLLSLEPTLHRRVAARHIPRLLPTRQRRSTGSCVPRALSNSDVGRPNLHDLSAFHAKRVVVHAPPHLSPALQHGHGTKPYEGPLARHADSHRIDVAAKVLLDRSLGQRYLLKTLLSANPSNNQTQS